MTQSIYDPRKTAWKALMQGAGTAALFAGADIVSEFPTSLDAWIGLWPALLFGLVAGLVKAAANYIKNAGRAGMP